MKVRDLKRLLDNRPDDEDVFVRVSEAVKNEMPRNGFMDLDVVEVQSEPLLGLVVYV